MLTIHAAVNKALESGAIEFYANEYAEPGYTAGARGILFANWNDRDHYDPVTKTRVTDDTTMSRLSKLAERAGYEIEWSDEWTTCSCGKAVRTSPDSYGWTRSFAEYDGEISCVKCVTADPTDYLESLEGNSDAAETMDIALGDYGYVKVNDESYQHGWHPGQNDSPAVIAKSLRTRGISRFLFRIDGVGQFDVNFSVYVHDDEWSLLYADGAPESKLPVRSGYRDGEGPAWRAHGALHRRNAHDLAGRVFVRRVDQEAVSAVLSRGYGQSFISPYVLTFAQNDGIFVYMTKTSVRYSRHLSVVTDRNHSDGWALKLLVGWKRGPFNKGAGYIGGATFFAVRNGRDPKNYHRKVRGWQFGLTRNAQAVPLLGEF